MDGSMFTCTRVVNELTNERGNDFVVWQRAKGGFGSSIGIITHEVTLGTEDNNTCSCNCNKPFTTGMYTADQMMGYAGSTLSYGEPCSYGGGSSTAQHEIGPSQLDEPPPITQPTQDYGYINFSGVEVAHI
ncbi:hypothetical protein OsJ_18421 [Oryza sativa Japonica Group]|uniref:Uncharacterized protein n=1 Tax=Oryza sativa subsp. japonica TaxID=39947 RepID=B9FPE8_ORYSJ|nr:hypothetical protein OsJ_18421 [Oryza sativa Japonica Group]